MGCIDTMLDTMLDMMACNVLDKASVPCCSIFPISPIFVDQAVFALVHKRCYQPLEPRQHLWQVRCIMMLWLHEIFAPGFQEQLQMLNDCIIKFLCSYRLRPGRLQQNKDLQAREHAIYVRMQSFLLARSDLCQISQQHVCNL